jgi:hypothetical protein
MLRFTGILFFTAAAIHLIAFYSGWLTSSVSVSVIANVFMFAMTLTAYRIVSGIDDQRRFTQVYLATIVIKIIAACAFTAVLIVLDRAHAKSNVVFLLVIYAVFTAIEVGFLLHAVRSKHT